jgi:hypothetical protein
MATPPSRYHASSANHPSPPNPALTQSASTVGFPGEDGGRSLAEMARRDLDAALQLLADRAQYITGASGAAIALRRNGKNDMLCRASSGSNAPELGALLSTEYGLSGESVRTRQPLRCDDAERDIRVNREVCRQLGIASVVVMPVVNDDGVLGVFELFSGKVNAFGERDLSAVQRLSELVETAVRLAEAAEKLPEQLNVSETSAPAAGNEIEEDKVLEAHVLDELGLGVLVSKQADSEEIPDVLEDDGLVLGDIVPKESKPVLEVNAATAEKLEDSRKDAGITKIEGAVAALPDAKTQEATTADPKAVDARILDAETETALTADEKTTDAKTAHAKTADATAPILSAAPLKDVPPMVVETAAAAAPDLKTVASEKVAAAAQSSPGRSTEPALPRKQLFWTAEINPTADAAKAEKADRSHVPPVLRNLRKCEACGFPVSADRALCVECEEKKWRGQLKPAGASRLTVTAVVPTAIIPTATEPQPAPTAAEPRALAAAAQSVAARVPASSTQLTTTSVTKSKGFADRSLPTPSNGTLTAEETKSAPGPLETSSSTFVLSSGLEPSESWLSANKYVLGVLVVVCIVVAAFLLLR